MKEGGEYCTFALNSFNAGNPSCAANPSLLQTTNDAYLLYPVESSDVVQRLDRR